MGAETKRRKRCKFCTMGWDKHICFLVVHFSFLRICLCFKVAFPSFCFSASASCRCLFSAHSHLDGISQREGCMNGTAVTVVRLAGIDDMRAPSIQGGI